MAETSHIQWTDATFNPWRGCTKVSPGCKNCYAETLSGRNPTVLGVWGPKGSRAIAAESYWQQPLKWERAAARSGQRRRVFCASLADVFEGEETMPASAHGTVRRALLRLLGLIFETPHLDWLLLTKRIHNVLPVLRRAAEDLGAAIRAGRRPQSDGKLLAWIQRWYCGQPPANVWLGTSAEDQATYDERWEVLKGVPAAVRFLSVEPMLGPIDLDLSYLCPTCEGQGGGRNFNSVSLDDGAYDCGRCEGTGSIPFEGLPDWVIVGGESGPGARPMNPYWARSVRDQCERAGVPFFYKQHGEWIDGREWADYRAGVFRGQTVEVTQDSDPDRCRTITLCRVGKKAAGRLLDGRTWDELPLPGSAVPA